MRKILLISFFNSGNIGDKAICKMLEEKLSDIAQVEKMDITGRAAVSLPVSKQDCAQHIVQDKRCRFYNLKYVVSLRMPDRLNYAKACIDRCDMVMIAGGNMIMDPEKFSLYSFLANRYVKYAKKQGKKTVFLFVGVGRIKKRIQKIRWSNALHNSAMISVRDALSRKRIIDELKVKKDVFVWKDPVFWLKNTKKSETHNKVAINVYLDAVKQPERRWELKQTYLHLISELRKEHDIVLYSTEKLDNFGLYEVYDALDDKGDVSVCCPDSLEELMEVYHFADVVIATRMHAFIIALTQNIPTVVLSWDAKINGVMADLGLTDFMVDIHTAFDRREELADQVHRLMCDDGKISEMLHKINQANQEEIDTCMKKIHALLEE